MKRRIVILQWLKTLKFRVWILTFIFVMVPIAFMVAFYYSNIQSREIKSLTDNTTSQAQLINSQIVAAGYLNPGSDSSIDARLNALREMFLGRIMIMDKSMKILIDTYNIYEGRILIWENALRSASGESVSHYDDTNNLLTVTIPIGSSEDISGGNIKGVILITRPTDYISQDMEYFGFLTIVLITVIGLIGILAAFVIVRTVSLPVLKLTRSVHELSDGVRTQIEPIDVGEIDKISEDINDFADKARGVDDQMREFVSNVSHELKTPLTSMKILADSITTGEDVPVEFYREFMEDITKEIDRESAIIDDLLKIVRSDGQTATFQPEETNLNELMEEILKSLSPLAERSGVELLLETFRPVMASVDRVKFSQAMINLVENAIKYNRPEGGFVHVSVNADPSHAFIRVEDNGIGIPDEDKNLIFERFFRVDKSHSREIDGTGLGLAIVKNIINLHKGQIRVESIEEIGTTFIIRIPLSTEGVGVQ